jgi:response regulator RpfG family c-di-GMP phosphodiesterase
MSRPATQQDLLFAEAPESEVAAPDVGTWKLLIVDDEKEIHDVTKLALDGFKFSGASLKFISAFSGEEAKRMIADNPDTAIILLDVVMETEHAGLEVVKYIREELRNETTRIVLRTGQPGQAPERTVITEYDINDYKDKTELTAQKLFTLMFSSLRSYRDILALEANRKGLRQVINASANIFELQSMNQFAQGVLEQLISLLYLRGDAMFCQVKGFAATRTDDALSVIAATGEFEDHIGRDAWTILDATSKTQLQTALSERKNIHSTDYYAAYFKSKSGAENVLFVGLKGPLGEVEKDLVEVFCRNVSIAFDNMYLKQDIEDTQRDIVYRLGEAVETRSKETGYHVKRIAEYSHLFAEVLGLSGDEAEILRLASPLHDVGKVAIPDAILNKPGKLTREDGKS